MIGDDVKAMRLQNLILIAAFPAHQMMMRVDLADLVEGLLARFRLNYQP